MYLSAMTTMVEVRFSGVGGLDRLFLFFVGVFHAKVEDHTVILLFVSVRYVIYPDAQYNFWDLGASGP